MTIPHNGVTADRKSPDKIQFLIDNHGLFTREELAQKLGETLRWVKRQLRALIASGAIKPTRTPSEHILKREYWTDEMKFRVKELRCRYMKRNEDICVIIEKEFNIKTTPTALEIWCVKFDIRFPSQIQWLREYFRKEKLSELLYKGMRVVEICEYLKENCEVSVSDDILLVYIKEIGLMSQKELRNYLPNEHAGNFSREWLQEKVSAHYGLHGIAEAMGVSTTIVQRRLDQENINLILHRKIWSENLDHLRDALLDVLPLEKEFSEEQRHQMVLGWLFGDGNLSDTGLFKVTHTVKQLDYLYVKCRVLRSFLSSVFTVPRNSSAIKEGFMGAENRMCASFSGFLEYKKYLNEDGSKNYELIVSELTDLGWACLYMDDGSFFGGYTVLTMAKDLLKKFENRYIFGGILLQNLVVKGIRQEYILPGMGTKIPGHADIGSFWKAHVPEVFEPVIKDDLSLSLVKKYHEEDTRFLSSAVEYYQKRGFPYFKISEDYLRREFKNLCDINVGALWKTPDVLRYVDVGNYIFNHFMPHMSEVKFKGMSPKESFEDFTSLRYCLQMTLRSRNSILPDFVYNNLVYFNGGVVGFPCCTAKALISKYSKEGDTIVDPCSGWGGRMLGAVTAKRCYVGYEPWKKTSDGLNLIKNFFSISNAEIFSTPFDPMTAPTSCSLVFTSPPYIDLEVYGSKITKEGWLKLMGQIFAYAESSLIPGGYLLVDLPKYLKDMLPLTSLVEKPSVFWHTSTRAKDIGKAQTVFVWSK